MRKSPKQSQLLTGIERDIFAPRNLKTQTRNCSEDLRTQAERMNSSPGNNNANNGNNGYKSNGKTQPQSPVSVASAVSSETNSETQSISDEQQASTSARDRQVLSFNLIFHFTLSISSQCAVCWLKICSLLGCTKSFDRDNKLVNWINLKCQSDIIALWSLVHFNGITDN